MWVPPPPTVEYVANGSGEDGASGEEPVARFDVETGRADLPDWWTPGWRNRLIWGDNKLVLSSLLDEFAGKVDLIYIDPPFATGGNFSYKARVGDTSVEKLPSMVEEVAFRDTWGVRGQGFSKFIHDRLALLRDLLDQRHGSIFLRLDYREGFRARAIMDEVFGRDLFRNEISVGRTRTIKAESGRFHHATDTLYFYSFGPNRFNGYRKDLPKNEWTWVPMHMVGERKNKALLTVTIDGRRFTAPIGRRWMLSQAAMDDAWSRGLIRIDEERGEPLFQKRQVTVGSNWTDVPGYSKRHGYPTENHERVLERVIEASSNPGDLVLDCFVGSGTTAAVAEKLGRRWIGVDIGRFAIQTTRKRLLDIPGCRPFEVQNLGSYERKYWQGHDGGDDEARRDGVREYVSFILELYKARPQLGQFSYIHGVKEGRAVHVGATDAPVTRNGIELAVVESQEAGYQSLDILGWEFEMGINSDLPNQRQTQFGDVAVRLFRIPREILDQKNVDAGGINFFELSLATAEVNANGDGTVTVALTDFMPAVDDYMREKISGDIPNKWQDWIDYWSVDFEYDGEVFINQWQAYRTRRDRSLTLTSDPHEYEVPGEKTIVVKVIDIFGNDTTRSLDHSV